MEEQNNGRYLKIAQVALAVLILIGSGGIGGFLIGQNRATNGAVTNTGSTKEAINFDTFWQAWGVVNDNYFGETDNTKRLDGAISGMVASLNDPYTIYLPPAEDKLFRADLEGSFSGIGAELVVKDGLLTIDNVLQDSPASKAGLQAKDVIIEIDGQKTASMQFVDAIDKIRGEKGSTVVLTIGREGSTDPLKISVVRDTITVKSVATDTLGANKDIAYIKLKQFGQDTTDLTRQALTDAASSGKKGIIIDLRDNPGGYLTSAADIIGMVLPASIDSSEQKLKDRVAVLERDKKGKETPYKATTASITPTLPIVVLVNGNSASASEIFSGAMKDYKRATVLGVKTFGKGSVQNLIKLDNGGSIKVTIAKWFTPLGVGIDKTGITPDITVELPKDVKPSTDDAQVQRALQVLADQTK